MNKKNYYDEIIEHIIEESKTDKEKAILMLKKELSMPYIPENYEQDMKKLLTKLDVAPAKELTATREEILECFSSEINNGKKLFLINKISEFNWSGYEKQIEIIFNDKKVRANFKSIFLEHLIEQKFDYVFTIGEMKINPSKVESIFKSEFCIKNIGIIENNSEVKDQIIKRIAVETLLIYVSSLFPNNVSMKFEDISKDLIIVANVLLGKSEKIITPVAQTILDFVSEE